MLTRALLGQALKRNLDKEFEEEEAKEKKKHEDRLAEMKEKAEKESKKQENEIEEESAKLKKKYAGELEEAEDGLKKRHKQELEELTSSLKKKHNEAVEEQEREAEKRLKKVRESFDDELEARVKKEKKKLTEQIDEQIADSKRKLERDASSRLEEEEAELKYMQEMLRNPQMQEMMYPYLPEMMRNPETFEMLLTNPMYKDQLKGIMAQMKAGGGDFTGGGMPDVNSPEVQEQFAAMGMTPQDAIQKLMGDPELAMAFQNPKIQQAVMDCSSNPNNIMKYQNDPEIMSVFMKLATMFPGAAGAGAGMPDMSGMPPQPPQ